MNVYGKITGKLSGPRQITGSLSGPRQITGILSIPTNSTAVMYDGDYEVTPTKYEQILNTQHKTMRDNVTVHKTPYAEVSNPYGGETVTIL